MKKYLVFGILSVFLVVLVSSIMNCKPMDDSVLTAESKYGIKSDQAVFEGVIVGQQEVLSGYSNLYAVGVKVDGHPEIQAAFFEVNDSMSLSTLNLLRKNQHKLKIHESQIEFIAGQPVKVWIIQY
jgi:hypothetical protein